MYRNWNIKVCWINPIVQSSVYLIKRNSLFSEVSLTREICDFCKHLKSMSWILEAITALQHCEEK